MDDPQRWLVGGAILIVGLAITLGAMSEMSRFGAFDYGRTWPALAIGAVVIGGIEYYLFAD